MSTTDASKESKDKALKVLAREQIGNSLVLQQLFLHMGPTRLLD